jgi:glycosyltransferase involved in cell wall biosynthesis
MNISIIIATYNRPQLLKKCLQSIQAQSFPDFETIIVDDGSSSDTGQAIETFIRDPRFKYIRLEKNSGQTMARNSGIDRAEGDYIMIWDDDDTLDANALQILSEAVRERPDALLISCGARLQQDNGTIRDVERRPTGFFGYDEIISGQIPDNEVVILVKRSELGSNRFRAKNIDFLFYHQLMSRGSWYHLDIDVGTIIITEQWSTLTQQRKIPNAQLSMERAPFLDEYLKKKSGYTH